MATFRDISEDYSKRIKKVVTESAISKSASYLTESEKQNQKQRSVVSILKEIATDIKQYSIENKPLTEDQKAQIIKGAGELLGLKKPESLVLMIKEASNDNFVALANYWSTFFAELKL